MQILIRRQGVSVRAAWGGLAKPSDKQLHYWLRVKPEAPIANASTSAAITHALLARAPANLDAPMTQVQGYTLTLNLKNVIDNSSASPAQPSLYHRTLLSTQRLWQNQTLTPARPIIDPRLQTLSLAGYNRHRGHLVSIQQVAAGAAPIQNSLRVISRNLTPSTTDTTTQAREGSVVLRAPLPDGPLIQPVVSAYDAAPAPTDPDHMELVTQVNDALAHTHWSRTPKPTHFVQETQTPVQPEILRRTTPENFFRGGLGNSLQLYGSGVHTLRNRGKWLADQGIQKYGRRGAISYPGTNGLTGSNYSGAGAFSGTNRHGDDTSGAGSQQFGVTATNKSTRYLDIWVMFNEVVPNVRGISLLGDNDRHVKDYDLYIVNQYGNWQRLGSYQTYGLNRRDYRYFTAVDTKGVRIIARSNWGDPTFTEILEAEVYML